VRKQTLRRTTEIEIKGTVETLRPIISMTESELSLDDQYYFKVRETASNKMNNLVNFAVFTIIKSSMSTIPIGAFSLFSLGDKRLMFRIAPESQWWCREYGFTPVEIITVGLIKEPGNKTNRSLYEELFQKFTKELRMNIRHYGLEITCIGKLWRWIESHKVLSILGAIASIASIIGVIIACLNYFS
jgi:hypothetical protein